MAEKMTTDEFKKKVFNYDEKKEWEYSGDLAGHNRFLRGLVRTVQDGRPRAGKDRPKI